MEDKEGGKEPPLPPPEMTRSGSSSSSAAKVSPGLAARMGKAIPIPVPGGKSGTYFPSGWRVAGSSLLKRVEGPLPCQHLGQ